MIKTDKLVEKRHKNINLSYKKSQASAKKVRKMWIKIKKKLQASVKKSQNCKFRWQKVTA